MTSARGDLDAEDEPIWTFLASVAVSADMSQQQALVTEAREKVLECVVAASSKRVSPEAAAAKIVRFASHTTRMR